jgi:hypothetical protein
MKKREDKLSKAVARLKQEGFRGIAEGGRQDPEDCRLRMADGDSGAASSHLAHVCNPQSFRLAAAAAVLVLLGILRRSPPKP